MYVCSNHTFPISKQLYIFKKKWQRLFKLYQALFICKKISADDWVGAGQKFDFLKQKSWFFCNSKHLSQNIMMPCYWRYFCIFYILHFFQIIMVSLFFAWHDQYFTMFKDSDVFEFANFPFRTKYNNTVVYSAISNYLLSRRKQEKIFFETILWLNLLSSY